MKKHDPFEGLPRPSMFKPLPEPRVRVVRGRSGKVTTATVDAEVGVTLRVAETLVARVDAFAEEQGLSRSAAIRRLLAERLA